MVVLVIGPACAAGARHVRMRRGIAWYRVSPSPAENTLMQTHGLISFLSLLLAAGAAAFVAVAAAPAHETARGSPSQAEHDANRYADASRWFRQGRHAAAYGRVAALADAGHLPSAQLALVMHEQGRALFGSEWSASPEQRRRWNTLVINAARQRVALPDNEAGD